IHVVRQAREALGELRGATIGLLGLAFKPNTDDMRDAPSCEIVELLQHEGAAIRACDPAAGRHAARLLPGVELCADPYETAAEAVARARQLEAKGVDVIHLEIGEPDFDTPRNIVDAGCRALQEGFTHYGPSPGLPDLRAAIARKISTSRGIEVAPEQVVV